MTHIFRENRGFLTVELCVADHKIVPGEGTQSFLKNENLLKHMWYGMIGMQMLNCLSQFTFGLHCFHNISLNKQKIKTDNF